MGQRPPDRQTSRPQLRRKLRDLIDHHNTEPIIRAEALRKYAQLFPHDDPMEPLFEDTKAFIIVDRRLYPLPATLSSQTFFTTGAGFRQRGVTYRDIIRATEGAERVSFHQTGRSIFVQYQKLISEETLSARFARRDISCKVRHLGGFMKDCRYQVNF
jgi:hypothetical protein